MSDSSLEKVLIIDDNSDYRKLINTFISKLLPSVEVIEYDPVFEGVPDDNFDWSQIDVLLLDYHLSIVGTTGLDILHKHHKKSSFPATIMLTGAGTEEIAIRALKSGIYEYQPKQTLTKDKLKQSIIHAWEDKKSERKKKQEITQHNRSFSKEVFYENLEREYDSKGPERALVIIKPDNIDTLEDDIGIIGRDSLVNHIAKNSFEVFKLGACNPNITRISDSEIGVQIDYPINKETLEFNMQGLCKHLAKCTFKFSEEKYTFTVSIGILKLGLFNKSAEQLINIAAIACDYAGKTEGNTFYIWKETDVSPESTEDKKHDANLTATSDTTEITESELEVKEKAETEAVMKAAIEEKEKLEAELKAREEEAKIQADLRADQEAKEKTATEEKIKAAIEEKEKLEAELKAREEEAETREKIHTEQEAKEKAETEAKIKAAIEEKEKLEAELKAREEEAKAQAQLHAEQEAREKAETEAKIKAAIEEKEKLQAELKARDEQAKEQARLHAEQEAREKAEAEAIIKATKEEKEMLEAVLKAKEEEAITQAALRAEKEAKEKAEAEVAMKVAKEEKEKLQAELEAIAKAKEAAEAEIKAAKEEKEKLQAELEAIAKAKQEPKVVEEEIKPVQPTTEAIDKTPETKENIVQPSNDTPDKTETVENETIEPTPSIAEIEVEVKKLIDEKKIIQTYQPVTAMFGDDDDETREIYQTGLQAMIDADKYSEYLLNTSVFSVSLQQTINEWVLRQVFLRITESGTTNCQYMFLITATESWFSDITLFQWLQKILAQTKKYNPGKSIILNVPLDLFIKHQKRAEALVNTLRKSHHFTIALSNTDVVVENIIEHCELITSRLLMVDIEQLKKLSDTLAPQAEEKSDNEDQDKQNLLQCIKSKNIRIITSGIEDSTLLTDAITAGTDYTLGNFVGEVQDNLIASSTVESFELT